VPIWYSGPHLGNIADVTLFALEHAPMLAGEYFLADKAYGWQPGLGTLFSPTQELESIQIQSE
jgi:hypothetical protein